MMQDNSIAVILLAAGSSARMGSAKQLLPYRGQVLLQHAIGEALASMASQVFVVLGAHAEQMRAVVDVQTVQVVVNAGWGEGIASSIRCGVDAVLHVAPETAGVLIVLCDQPYMTSALLNDLIAAYAVTGKPIVACQYVGTVGAPVLFHKSMFAELLQLKGDVGAKALVGRHSGEVATVVFAQGGIDIDTPQDYKDLLENESSDQ